MLHRSCYLVTVGTNTAAARWCWIGLIGLGCAALAGIDDEYVAAGLDAASPGGAGGDEGGTFGSSGIYGRGGVDGSGGAGGSGGVSGTAGSAGAAGGACEQGQKFCGSACVTPSIENGCALTGCERCPDPTIPHSVVVCLSNVCAGECESGYVPSQGECVQGTNGASGTGGSAGTGGTNGATGTAGASGSAGQSDSGGCNPPSCPDCIVGLRCCTGAGRCGCQHGVPPFVNPYCLGP